jgi:molecular chaperone GrpE
MRALAEAENTRVRMRKQVDDAKVFGIQNFCKDLLEVADILNLAIVNTSTEKFTGVVDATKADENKSKLIGTEFKAMYNGLKLTETKLMKIFEKHGLNRIEPKEGDKFDPNLHEAIFQTPVPNKEPGSICAITQNGYKLQERVIRAAKVGVVQ